MPATSKPVSRSRASLATAPSSSVPAFSSAAVLLAALPLVLSSPARASDGPRDGDPVNGARLFQLHCADCHGAAGVGDGPLAAKLDPPPANLKDGGLLWALTDTGLLEVVNGGGKAKGKSSAMPAHAGSLTELEQRDIVVWLKQGVPPLSQFFPQASRYIAHEHTIDEFGVERAKEALKRELTDDERTHMVFTLFTPESGPKPAGEPVRVAETPAALYSAKPKHKVGFVVYLPLTIEGRKVRSALALDRGMRLTHVITVPAADPAVERVRRRYEKTLAAFAGSGGRVEKKPVRPYTRGVTASKALLAEMQRAYVVVLEAVAMYEKEERERFWADPDAFRTIEEPEEVQFQLKNRRR